MRFGLIPTLAAVFVAIARPAAPAPTAPDKHAQWDQLIAEAIKHGGVPTKLSATESYVFAGPNGLNVTFTRTLDNRVRAVCAMYLSANINVCMNWDTEKLTYATRADANSPWVKSDAPPPVPETAPETPFWLDLLSAFFDTPLPYSTYIRWSHGGVPHAPRIAFSHAFSHGFMGLHHH
jgi:hypothetical protein